MSFLMRMTCSMIKSFKRVLKRVLRRAIWWRILCIVLTSYLLVNSQYIYRVSYRWKVIVNRHVPYLLIANLPLSPNVAPHSSPSKLLINTSACQIPYYDLWDLSIMPYVDNRTEGKICHGVLTHVEVDGTRFWISRSTLKSMQLKKCFFEVVPSHLPAPQSINPSFTPPISKTFFRPEQVMSVDADFVKVSCTYSNFVGLEREAFLNFVALAYRNPQIANLKAKRKRMPKRKSPTRPSKRVRNFSVHIIGIDSASRLNVHRFMPKMCELAKQLGGIEFYGFNKVGDGTIDNLKPALTGQFHNSSRPIRSLPWIWNEYHQHGFWTIHGEDWQTYTKPLNIDHSYEPLAEAMDASSISFQERILWPFGRCYGDLMVDEKIFEWYYTVVAGHSLHDAASGQRSKDFADEIFDENDSRDSVFSFVWTSDWSHDDISFLKRADKPTKKLFTQLEEVKVLENDFVIFMGDHGIRNGRMWGETTIGYHELSLPLLVFFLPAWFQRQYPNFVANMKTNAGNRLVTHFDLHETLKHLLRIWEGEEMEEARDQQEARKGEEAPSPRRFSLFHRIPEDRDCEDAGIPMLFCSCGGGEFNDLRTDDPEVVAAAEAIVDALNRALEEDEDERGKCAILKLKEIRGSYSKQIGSSGAKLLMTTILTTPGNAQLEVGTTHVIGEDTIGTHAVGGQEAGGYANRKQHKLPLRKRMKNQSYNKGEMIEVHWQETNRLNRYGDTSSCVPYEKRLLRKICFCH